jgi:hypothetical protein
MTNEQLQALINSLKPAPDPEAERKAAAEKAEKLEMQRISGERAKSRPPKGPPSKHDAIFTKAQ